MDAQNLVPRPVSVYGATKLTQEQVLAAWSAAHGVELAILRLQNDYGPGQSRLRAYRRRRECAHGGRAMGGRSIPLFEDGEAAARRRRSRRRLPSSLRATALPHRT